MLRLIVRSGYCTHCCVEISFDVENTGKYDGEEVAQLYIRDEYASVVRALRQLKHFKRFFLKQGEKKLVSMAL